MTPLHNARSILAHPVHNIVVLESDGRRVNRLRSIDTVGDVHPLAGAEPACPCDARHCPCATDGSSEKALMHSPNCLGIDPLTHSIYICDQGNHKVRVLRQKRFVNDDTTINADSVVEVQHGVYTYKFNG